MKVAPSSVRLALFAAVFAALAVFTGCTVKVTVSPPTITPSKVAPGQPVTIGVNVLNLEKKLVDYKVELKVNDAVVDTQQVPVNAGETKVVSFQYIPASLGSYTADVNGQKGVFDAVKPATFSAATVTVSPDTLVTGKEIKVSAEVKNDGELPGKYAATLRVDGKEISTRELQLGPGESAATAGTFSVDVNGMHVVEYCGVTKGVRVLKPAEFRATSVSVSPASVVAGEKANVSATITNAGEVPATLPVAMLVNGQESASQTVTLEPGASTSITFAVTRDGGGSHTISVLGSSTRLSVIELKKYVSKYFGYSISYPPDFTVNDSNWFSVVIERVGFARMVVVVDRAPVASTPKSYFDEVARSKKQQLADWTSSSLTEVVQNGAVIGYKYDYSYDSDRMRGNGVVVKKGGLGFYAVFFAQASVWERNRSLASRCIDTFVGPDVGTGAYSGQKTGASLTLPAGWSAVETGSSPVVMMLTSPHGRPHVEGRLFVDAVPAGATPQDYVEDVGYALADDGYRISGRGPFRFASSANGYEGTFSLTEEGQMYKLRAISMLVGSHMYSMVFTGYASAIDSLAGEITTLTRSLTVSAPGLAGVSKSETLVRQAGEIPTLDPAVTDEAPDDVIGALFSGLVKIDSSLKVVPDLAERWTVSSDGKTYTFYVRRNARFHSGRQVTAADVKYSWERACDPALKSPKSPIFLNDIVGARDSMDGKAAGVSGIKVIDDYTLEVTIDAAKQYFLQKLAQPVAYIVDRANVAQGAKWYEQPNGTGPFKLKSWQKDTTVVLERNEDFYLGPAKLKNVVFKLFSGYGMRLYESGEIDIVGVGADDLDKVLDVSNPLNKQLVTGEHPGIHYVAFNVSKPPFDDPKVRRAFALAIDVPKIIEVSLKGKAQRAAGYIPPGIPGHNTPLQPLSYDAAQAKSLIAQSRYQSADKLPVVTVYVPYRASPVDEAIISMWQQVLGIQVKVEAVSELVTYLERARRDEFQLYMGGWYADFADPQNFLEVLFHSQSPENGMAYSNAQVDAGLAEAAAEADEPARFRKYQDVEKLVLNDLPAFPLYYSPRMHVLVKPYVKGYSLLPISVNLWRDMYVEPH